jgi:uncharacterized integral membrane protein
MAADPDVKLKQLEHERDVTLEALRHMRSWLLIGLFAVLITSATTVVPALLDRSILSGWQLTVIFLAIIAGIVIIFGFIFGRLVKIDVELSRERRRLGIDAGKRARIESDQ